MKRVLHFFALLLALAAGTIMVSAARSSWSIHQGNGRLLTAVFPEFPAPSKKQRILIVSPHPDDETLGCGGLIRRAREQGIPVTVALVTNGDAFPWAVQRTYRKLRPTPADYVRFGKLRQKETWNALGKLGVPKEDVIFMGYPDRGLEPLWMTNWASDKPYTSVRTFRSRNPYPVSYRPMAPYTGESLTEDLRNIIRSVKPTDLFFTHPNDDHPDHAYLSGFILSALQDLDANDWTDEDRDLRFESFHATPHGIRLHTFLVHRGNWPTPQGHHPGDKLPPPAAIAKLDTDWRVLPLTSGEIQAKTDAIRAYKTQMQVRPGARFLLSFVRQNELFGDYRFLLSSGSQQCGPHYSTKWFRTQDPVDDKVQRDLEPGADLQEVKIRRVRDRLVVRVKARGSLSRWVKYRVNVHTLSGEDAGKAATLRFVAVKGAKNAAPGIPTMWDSNTFEAQIPLKAVGNPAGVVVNAETIVGGMVVDRSAWRGFE